MSSCGFVDAIGQCHARTGDEAARIVSLVPSVTELLFDLGLESQVVGRTGFCIHPRDKLRQVPKLGGTKDVHLDRLRELAPTHVIVNIDENTRETTEAIQAFVPNIVVTHPCRAEDNVDLYRLIGGVFNREAQAESLVSGLHSALCEARTVRESLCDERVLYLIWREPWMTVSRQTYIASMLETVGWMTLPVEATQRYPVVDWQRDCPAGLTRVFLSSEPYRFRQKHLAEVEGLSGGRANLIDGEMVSWYGSRAITGLRYLTALRSALSGELAQQQAS